MPGPDVKFLAAARAGRTSRQDSFLPTFQPNGSMVPTHTRTHVYVTFANPYLVCEQCGGFVPRWHNPAACGCDGTGWRNEPCGHQAEASSCCLSWGPVDGCLCQRMFGAVNHPSPPGDQR